MVYFFYYESSNLTLEHVDEMYVAPTFATLISPYPPFPFTFLLPFFSQTKIIVMTAMVPLILSN